jgi:hypothetical protein
VTERRRALGIHVLADDVRRRQTSTRSTGENGHRRSRSH